MYFMFAFELLSPAFSLSFSVIFIVLFWCSTGWSKVNDINWTVISQLQRHFRISSQSEKLTYIYWHFDMSKGAYPICFGKNDRN